MFYKLGFQLSLILLISLYQKQSNLKMLEKNGTIHSTPVGYYIKTLHEKPKVHE